MTIHFDIDLLTLIVLILCFIILFVLISIYRCIQDFIDERLESDDNDN